MPISHGGSFAKERQNITPLELTANNYVAIAIDAVNLKNRLRDIETNRRGRLHDLAPPNHWVPKHPSLHGTLVPRVEEPSTASSPDMPYDTAEAAMLEFE